MAWSALSASALSRHTAALSVNMPPPVIASGVGSLTLKNAQSDRLESLYKSLDELYTSTCKVKGNRTEDLHQCFPVLLKKTPVLGLKGMVCVIGGASRGIGHGIAVRFGRAGAKVCVLSRSDGKVVTGPGTIGDVVRQVEEAGGEGLAVSCDVSKPASVDSAVETILGQFKCIDVVVNNASALYPYGVEVRAPLNSTAERRRQATRWRCLRHPAVPFLAVIAPTHAPQPRPVRARPRAHAPTRPRAHALTSLAAHRREALRPDEPCVRARSLPARPGADSPHEGGAQSARAQCGAGAHPRPRLDGRPRLLLGHQDRDGPPDCCVVRRVPAHLLQLHLAHEDGGHVCGDQHRRRRHQACNERGIDGGSSVSHRHFPLALALLPR